LVFVSDPRIFYSPRPNATPEAELHVLANVYAFLLKSRVNKKTAELTPERDGPDHVREVQDAHTATRASIPQ